MREIVKIQVPLFSTDFRDICLVYARGHRNVNEQRVPPLVRHSIADTLKGYFEATWEDMEQRWIIGKRVADQTW